MKLSGYLYALFLILNTSYAKNLFGSALDSITKKERCGTVQALIDFDKGIDRPRPSAGPKYRYTTHFIIHFDTTGSNATTRAFVETTAVHAELSWSGLTALSWTMPPPDGTNGGDSRYDIYIRNIGYYGLTYPESPYTILYPDGYTSWVEINNTMSWGDLRATIIHEFHHAIQMGYSKFETPLYAFYENTSTFIEDIFYDDVNYLQGVLGGTNDPLDKPYAPICNNSVDEYAGALWAHFLDEYYDAGVETRPIQRIWDLCGRHAGAYLRIDTDSILRLYYTSDLKKALGHYAIWRSFCGTINDNRHYIEGSTYGNIAILRTHTTYPASGNEGTQDPIGPGGCNVINFTNFGTNRVTLNFDGQNNYDWACYVIGFCADGTSYEYKLILDPTQATGSITIPGWEFNKIFMIPIVVHWTAVTPALTYTYNVTLSADYQNMMSEIITDNHLILAINPNPIRQFANIYYNPLISQSSLLNIYTAEGRLIKTCEIYSNKTCFRWNLDDNNGNKVNQGVYIIEIRNKMQTIRQKVVLLE